MVDPEFDFQIGSYTRLRGRGPRGIIALLLMLVTLGIAVLFAPSWLTDNLWVAHLFANQRKLR
jgi:hypothetical protein